MREQKIVCSRAEKTNEINKKKLSLQIQQIREQ